MENHRNTWRSNNILLNNAWAYNKIKEEMERYLETHGNDNKTTKNLCDTEKTVLREKFKAIQAYLKKQEKFQINN